MNSYIAIALFNHAVFRFKLCDEVIATEHLIKAVQLVEDLKLQQVIPDLEQFCWIVGQDISKLGSKYFDAQRFEEALTYYEKAHVLLKKGKPNFSHWRHLQPYITNCFNIGYLYYQKGKFSIATDYFDTAMACAKTSRSPYLRDIQKYYNLSKSKFEQQST